MFKDYQNYDALGLAALVKSGQVSPKELLETAIQWTEWLNPTINAVSYLQSDAMEFIDDTAALGPFFGVPFLVKNLGTAVNGMPGTMGSRLLDGNVWNFDAEIVHRYKMAGLQIFGLTNVPEFGICVSSESALYGPVKNPYNTKKTAGGSSGGAAAAVAAGIVPAANASDGGGSIRIPSACCGVFGLKPTRGRNPLGPQRSESWGGLVVEHVVTKSVRDSAALLDVTKGPDIGAYYYAPPFDKNYLDETALPPPTLKIGFFEKIQADQSLASENRAALMKTLRCLEKQGHHVVEFSPVIDVEKIRPLIIDMVACNIAYALNEMSALKRIAIDQILQCVEPVTRQFFELGIKKSAGDYIGALAKIQQFSREFARQTNEYDLLVTPVLASLPVDLGVLAMNNPDLSAYISAQYRFSPYTALFNYTGQPAASVPMHFSPDGLPVGVQIVARYAREDVLFRVCAALEEHFLKRRPLLRPQSLSANVDTPNSTPRHRQ